MKATDTAAPSEPVAAGEPVEPTKPTRTKSPRYDVYRVNGDGHLVPLATDVAAPTRKKAIEKQDDPYGSFATARTGELVMLTRGKKVVEKDDWS
jgi:hypothetical protein